jgi:hypothetical protein
MPEDKFTREELMDAYENEKGLVCPFCCQETLCKNKVFYDSFKCLNCQFGGSIGYLLSHSKSKLVEEYHQELVAKKQKLEKQVSSVEQALSKYVPQNVSQNQEKPRQEE